MTGPSPESTPTRPADGGGTIPVREYFEALRAADEKLRQALEAAEKALEEERDRRYGEREMYNQKAIEVARAESTQALVVIAEALKEYKQFSNEWRGTMDDVISRMTGSKEGSKETSSSIRNAIIFVVLVSGFLLGTLLPLLLRNK